MFHMLLHVEPDWSADTSENAQKDRCFLSTLRFVIDVIFDLPVIGEIAAIE